MRVIGVVSAAVLGVCALTVAAPAAVASGGDGRSYGGDSRSEDGGGRSGGGGGGDSSWGGGGGGGGGRSEEGGDGGGGGYGGGGGGKPEHFQHGVRAGEGGTIAGFDLKEIGLGTALIGGSVGAAYCLSRRRTGEEGTA
ncbi:hypothetical protein HUT11_33380 [Streptomyces seoulensis]|nr:hypothetical protein HUT11_33380 [Streptomyces seoulensis]